MYLDYAFVISLGYLVAGIVLGFVLGKLLGLLVNRVLDRTVERWLDETQIGKELRKIKLDFSDTVGLYTALFVFILFVLWGVQQVAIAHPWWTALIKLINYSLVVLLGFAFITVALLFVVFLSDYFGRLVSGYNKEVGELLTVLLLVGLIAVVVKAALAIMGLEYTILSAVMNGFVAFAIGWVITDFLVGQIEKKYKEFKDFAPYGRFVVMLIFILVGLNAIFARYLSTEIIRVLAWGVVLLFAVTLLPFVVRAIKQLYE